MQNVATINRTCRNHRVVALAKSTSGNRPRMSYEANIATVVLVQKRVDDEFQYIAVKRKVVKRQKIKLGKNMKKSL
jgi:hypothetical protein